MRSAPTRRSFTAAILISGVACATATTIPPGEQPASAAPPTGESLVAGVRAAIDRHGPDALWPGFTPGRVPLALYDGERTWLLRHPAPPPEFTPVDGDATLQVAQGRHAAVTANSSALIGEVRTATVMANGEGDVRTLAAVAAHEAFHVHQLRHYPRWQANEVELLTYPVRDGELLALRRLELRALQRALLAPEDEQSRCQAREAMAFRHDRVALLPAGASEYERRTELWEGLASYVQTRAAVGDARAATAPPPSAERPRQHFYLSGELLALLLDRFVPGWQRQLTDSAEPSLDALLAINIGAGSGERCRPDAGEEQRLRAGAMAEARALSERLTRMAREFAAREGWTLRIEASSSPMQAEGFDPLNVQVVDDSTVLHRRFVRLGHPSGRVEVVGAESLTIAAGPHPLFAGVRAIVITGLRHDPLTVSGDSVLVRDETVAGAWRGARTSRDGQMVRVLLP